ncbi:MAG: sulfatase [Methylovulum sp.]|nr:sulfatase [Methylovulum sp.]
MNNTIKRREFLSYLVKAGVSASALLSLKSPLAQQITSAILESSAQKPNVLMLCIDDLNDWVGVLGGYPGVHTPNIDALAQSGMLYTNAHAAAPSCSPSRAATLFSYYPFKSGVYSNKQYFDQSPNFDNRISLPYFFKLNGYDTYGTGKIFHGRDDKAWTYWEDCETSPQCTIKGSVKNRLGDPGKIEPHTLSSEQGVANVAPYYTTQTHPDAIRTQWLCEQVLQQSHTAPFFAALGLIKPHAPYICPQEFFDLYPLEDIALPPGMLGSIAAAEHDLHDVPERIAKSHRYGKRGSMLKVLKNNELNRYIQGYLANISFADWCVGQALAALNNGPNKDNTLVMLWSDHGYQMGEKVRMTKYSVWEHSTRVPLIFAGPGITPGVYAKPVSLMDIYPTLTDWCLGVEPDGLDGISFARQLRGTVDGIPRVVVTTHGYDGIITKKHSDLVFAARTERYRLIRYSNETQTGFDYELYDHSTDPYETNNLLANGKLTLFQQTAFAKMDALFPNLSAVSPPTGSSSKTIDD